ncbi:glycosyltransferase family 4 protein [Nitrospirillum sp. BR 11828]|uniref:glycosyltransferase family 4 protein n=1 Tax=Nitrospirillum sp. BR 11828 TaxID=3104325 RepID=UPI002ACAD415|nr:glycosyltransferase family 4 protein [Nitrospirillum sp. BR 11828]MDZ5645685.1 glycosyltransferase family 4 protein [Nitrospirillum sp. BR 11828]
MRILFTFENSLASTEADAEVFTTTARYLAALTERSWMHVPVAEGDAAIVAERVSGLTVVPAHAPARPAALRHFLCGLTLPFRAEFKQADLVYTRNLWVAWMALLFGQRVAFDHYRPWPDQIPPLQYWLYRLVGHRRFIVKICHSEYTRRKYLALGLPEDKVRCIRNGFEPARFQARIPVAEAKRRIGVEPDRKTVVYTGRVNHKKGLALAIEAARLRPDVLFILVGSYGEGPIEVMARDVPNVRIVPYQTADALADYIYAADILLIPPSRLPLAEFGSTVLPLKVFFYLASGRPILAGQTPDVAEVLRHDENAYLCPPDSPAELVAGIDALLTDPARAHRLAEAALSDSQGYTWAARAARIHALIQERLTTPAPARRPWGKAEFRAWFGQSRDWLRHLLRTRALVLPPRPDPGTPPSAAVDRP